MLWVDRYRPKSLDKMIVHEDIAANLKKLVSEQDCPHLLFYGPPGSGKKTLIMALMKQMFGSGAEKVKMENKAWKVYAGSRTIELELTTLSSSHHVELNLSDAGFQDRYIVQEIIKEMTKNRSIDTKGKKGFKGGLYVLQGSGYSASYPFSDRCQRIYGPGVQILETPHGHGR